LSLSNSINAQCDNLDSTYNASFANTPDTSGWAIIDNNGDNNTWKVYASFSDTTLKYFGSSVINANDWAFSQCLSLDAVNAYSLSFDCNKGFSGIEKLMIMITSAQDTSSIIDTLYNMDSIYWTSPQSFDTTFHISSNGDYFIAFKVYSDKTSTSLDIDNLKFEKFMPTLMPEVSTCQFNIFPNPANKKLNISLIDNRPSSISIIDIQGKVIKSIMTNKPINTFDISNFDKGIYFIRLLNDKTNLTKRIMIF
jgi:hypothetical protein